MNPDDLAWRAAATANLLKAGKKYGRLGSKKSRTGCLTCRQRRVKCDEVRPQCSRCLSAGRKCDWYAPSTVPLANPISKVGCQPPQFLGLQNDDRRRLDFYLSQAAPCLAGYLDRAFWRESILQIAQSEPIILDSLLAISTLYEHPQYMGSFRNQTRSIESPFDFICPRESVSSKHWDHSPPVDVHHKKAIQLYNRAIRGLQQRLGSGKATPFLALVSCVLFICIETIRDHVFAAIALFEKGLEMLKQLSPAVTSESEQEILAYVKQMFSRLGVLATTFGHPSFALQQFDERYSLLDSNFPSISEARSALFALVEESCAFCIATDEWRQVLYRAKERPQQWEEPCDLTSGVEIMDTNIGSEPSQIVRMELSRSPLPIANVQTQMHQYNDEALPVRIDLRTLDQLSRNFGNEDVGGPMDGFDHAPFGDIISARRSVAEGAQAFIDLQERQTQYLFNLERWRQAFERKSNSPMNAIWKKKKDGGTAFPSEADFDTD